MLRAFGDPQFLPKILALKLWKVLMNIISTIKQLVIKIMFVIIASNSMFSQAQEENLLQQHKTHKPLVLDIRFCSCAALDFESEATAPTQQFLEEANSIKVGVLEAEIGFVSSGGLTFGYSITPSKENGLFELQYSEEYIEGKNSLSSQSVMITDLNNWVVISGYGDISEQGNEYFSVAVKLALSTKNQ